MPASAAAGAEVRLAGRGLGTDPAAVNVRFGSQAAPVLGVADSAITCEVPLDGAGALAVSIGGAAIKVSASFTYIHEELVLSGFTPQAGPPGTEVAISGSGFGTRTEWLSIEFGGQAAQVLSCGCEELHVAVPVAAASGPVTVRRGVQAVQSAGVFTVTQPEQPQGPPQVLGFSPAEVWPLEVVHVTGFNFGTDLSGVMVYVGGKRARLAALGGGELVLQPVPGTAGGPVRVVTAGGEDACAGELVLKPYPAYFAQVTTVSTQSIGPAGLLGTVENAPLDVCQMGGTVIDGLPLEFVGLTGDTEPMYFWYQAPAELAEGGHYVGIPNKLKDEDKRAGQVDGEVWVTAYYPQPVTVSGAGRTPPRTSGLEPYVVYGNVFQGVYPELKLAEVDLTQPLGVLLDGEPLFAYPGGEDPEAFQSQFSYVLGGAVNHFSLGEHSITVVTADGCGTAAPGYRVASTDEVVTRVDSMEPMQARVGDLVTLTGPNLHWLAAGSYPWNPVRVRVGGVAVPPIIGMPPFGGGSLNEMQFLVTGNVLGGEVEVDIEERYGTVPPRTLKTGLTLSVDRSYIDSFDKYYIPADSVTQDQYSCLYSGNQTAQRLLADTGELYCFPSLRGSADQANLRQGYFTSAGYTDLGLIDTAPAIFSGYEDATGPYIAVCESHFRPDGARVVAYCAMDEVNVLKPDYKCFNDFRIATIGSQGTQITSILLRNGLTGEGVAEADLFESGMAFDETGGCWLIADYHLLHWDGADWTDTGDEMPKQLHEGSPIQKIAKMAAQADGTIKALCVVNDIDTGRRSAIYFIERSPAGEWQFTQVLGQEEEELGFAFDKLGRARVFDNDTENIYIMREENGFAKEVWLPFPLPAGAKVFEPYKSTGYHNVYVKYDQNNRAVGLLSAQYTTAWEGVWFENDISLNRTNYILREGPSGEVSAQPVSVIPSEISFNHIEQFGVSLAGIVSDWNISGQPELNPAGTRLLLLGPRNEYVSNESDPGSSAHNTGMYVYSREL